MKRNLFGLLRKKDLFLLISGGAVSSLGTDALAFAMSLYVLQSTGSATLFASVVALGMIPEILLAPIGGALADRYNKKKILVSLDFISGIILAAYSIYFIINKNIPIHLIYLLVILQSIISAIFNPCISTIVPLIVEDEELVDANLINSICMRTVAVVSPLIASLAYGIYGLLVILIIDSFSFFVSSITEMFIRIPQVDVKKSSESVCKTFVLDIKEGLEFLIKDKFLISISVIGILMNFSASPLGSVGITYLLKVNLQVKDVELGLMNSIIIGVSIAAPFICSFLFKKNELTKIFFKGTLWLTIILVLMSFISSNTYISLFDSNTIPFISVIITMCLIFISASITNMAFGILLQKRTPKHMMGRVGSTLNSLLSCAMPCGQMIFGCALDIIPISVCLGVCSLLLGLSVIVYYIVILKNEENESSNIEEEASV